MVGKFFSQQSGKLQLPTVLGERLPDMRSLALWDDGGRSIPLGDVSGDEAAEKGSGQKGVA